MSEPMAKLSVEITASSGKCQISPMEMRFAFHHYKT
jgi:hypothetical protein